MRGRGFGGIRGSVGGDTRGLMSCFFLAYFSLAETIGTNLRAIQDKKQLSWWVSMSQLLILYQMCRTILILAFSIVTVPATL